ncbi:MAG: lytic transglycosylase domain-containing protein [Thiomargarita sp.]|nr:lytic transglycosylase domain-containing protein [Thiomargarita sp.]
MKKIYILMIMLLTSPIIAKDNKIYSYIDIHGVKIYTNISPKKRQKSIEISSYSNKTHSGKIYKFIDSDGVIHLTNQPQGSHYKLVSLETTSVSSFSKVPPINKKFKQYQTLIHKVSTRVGVEAALLHAIIQVESAYNPKARSPKGAAGLMQLMPQIAAHYGVTDPTHAASNISGGAQLIFSLLKTFNNNLELALAAYNAGITAVKRYGNKIPPYKETQNYVRKVMGLYIAYQKVIKQ